MTLSTHVLDVENGRPLAGLEVTAHRLTGGSWLRLGAGRTDDRGRCADLVDADEWQPGRWRLVFVTGRDFFPEITLEFQTADATHHHVPLLLAGHGYTTYRGS